MKEVAILIIYLLYKLFFVFGIVYATHYLDYSNWLWLCIIILGVDFKYNKN